VRIRRLWLVLVAMAIPAAAGAHEHKMDWYAGGGVESGSTLVGLHTTLGVPLAAPTVGGAVKILSAEVDTSIHWGSRGRRRTNVLGGLRYTLAHSTEQTTLPFLHVLAGGAENTTNAGGGWGAALAVGGGFDAMIGGAHAEWGVRAQADYIVGPGRNGSRVTVGVVKRWLK
jgi:hypothetical protein